MTTSQSNLVKLAKSGDVRAITTILDRQLQPKGIAVKAAMKDGCLQVMLEATQSLDQRILTEFLRKGFQSLSIPTIKRVKIYGKRKDEEFPDWLQEVNLAEQRQETQQEDCRTASSVTNQKIGQVEKPRQVSAKVLVAKRSPVEDFAVKHLPKLKPYFKMVEARLKASSKKSLLAAFLGCCALALIGSNIGRIFPKTASPEAKAAILAFEKIDSRVEVGVNIQEYLTLASEAKFALEQYQLTDGADEEVVRLLKSSLEGHILALEFWRCDLETDSISEMRCQNAAIQAIGNKYAAIQTQLDEVSEGDPESLFSRVGKPQLLSEVWERTEADVAEARSKSGSF